MVEFAKGALPWVLYSLALAMYLKGADTKRIANKVVGGGTKR